MLRTVIGADAKALHGIVTQAGAQTFMEPLPGEGLLGPFFEELAVCRSEARKLAGDQAYRQYRGRQLQLFETPTGQLEEHVGVTLGAQEPDRHLAVGHGPMLQMQNEALYAAIAPGQVGGQVRGQAPHWKQQCLMRLDLEIQLDPLLKNIRWTVKVQG